MEILIIIAQVLFVVFAVLMAFAILLQEGKGGGLSAMAGGASQQIIGTSNPLRKITIVFAVAFFSLAVFLAMAITSDKPAATTSKTGQKTSEEGEKKEGEEGGAEESIKAPEPETGKSTDK